MILNINKYIVLFIYHGMNQHCSLSEDKDNIDLYHNKFILTKSTQSIENTVNFTESQFDKTYVHK